MYSRILQMVALMIVFRIVGIVLRRFALGSVIISKSSKLIYLLPLGFLGDALDISWMTWFHLTPYMLLLKMSVSSLILTSLQIPGLIVPYITHKFKLPSKENYAVKGNYILPFTGKWTVANGAVTKNLSHSWSLLPQRYAYDVIIMDDEGKSFSGDNRSVESYYCYGKDIVAPADGVVVKLSNRHKDSFVDGKNPYCDASTIAGNHITIKHNDDEYSFIAHIMKDSFAVKAGDKVKQGEVIAKCGNTGNSSEPHIHFQLNAGKSFNLSAGLPIAFSNIKANAKANYEKWDKRITQKEVLKAHEDGTVYIGRGLEVENGSRHNE